MTDHANEAAATTAGWVKQQLDRGSGKVPRYITRFFKWVTGDNGAAGQELRVEVTSNVSQAQADTDALTALNKQRALRYGAGAAAGQGSKGKTYTFDVD